MRAIVLAGLQQLANDGGEITQVATKQGVLEALSLSRKTSCIRILKLNELVVLHWKANQKKKKTHTRSYSHIYSTSPHCWASNFKNYIYCPTESY